MQPEWQHIFMTREIVPQTVPPRLPMWMLPKLYSQACAVDCHYLHISFSSQMIRFSSSRTCGTWPYSPFFVCHPFFYILSFFFVRQKMFHVTNIIIDAKTQQQGMYTCKILKLHHLKGTISENICIHQKFLVGGSFAPHRLFNLCDALSECFYTRVLLGLFECFYWVPERCFVIQCDTNPLFR
jgi:hypothetical protein